MVAMNLSAQEAELRMAKIAEQVRKCAGQTQLPMEISYGIAQSKQYDSYEKMFAAADGAMYEMKKKHKQQNPAVVRLKKQEASFDASCFFTVILSMRLHNRDGWASILPCVPMQTMQWEHR